MPKQKTVLFLLFFLVCAKSFVFSQISSTSGSVSVCAPANITYTAPAGATSISWTFGGTATFTNATGSFNALVPTSFNAVFNGIVAGSPVSFTVPVVVHAVPVANFGITQPSNGCAPVTVTLTDQSTSSSPLQGWQWVYGDGNTNTFTVSTPHTHAYTSLGTYSVTLIVTDANGCDDLQTLGTVNVTAPPVAIINSNPPVLTGCSSVFNAVFSASNSVGTGLSYSWNFGNSQTSNLVTTGSITFTSQASQYPVTLTVTANGCSAVASTFVTVSPATLSVTLPSTVCLNAAGTATVQSNQPYSSWNLGAGGTIFVMTPASSNPTVNMPVFTSAGIQSFTIQAGIAPCTTPPLTQTVFVEQVVASFTSSTLPLIGCNPLMANYTNLSSPAATQFQWSYNNFANTAINTSTLANPTFTFVQGSLSPYTVFYSTYTPTITLIATSPSGCSGTISHTVHTVRQPTSWFNKDKKQGCVPLAVTFSDSSYVFPADPIASYTWCNGETPPVFVSGTGSVIPSQVFTYTTNGIYYPYLIIQTAGGCVDVSYIDTVTVVDPPIISFAVSANTVCPNQALQIINTSPNISTIQHWHVESDNGFFSGCVNDPNPSWKYTNTGTHTISLSGYKNGCKTTTVLPQTITVKGPLVELRFETNCSSRKAVTFYSQLQEVQTANLNFGDNSSLTIVGNPTGTMNHTLTAHTYSATGDYTVILTGTNTATGCLVSSYSTVVHVRDVTASFITPTINCSGTPVGFDATASVDVYTGCSVGYVWYIDDLPPRNDVSPFATHSFTSVGIHTVNLTVKDLNSCLATVTHTLRVSDVAPAFASNTNTVCLSTGTIQLTNTTAQVPDPITNYFWDFGNGQTLSTSQQTVPIITYSNAITPATNYTVVLTASSSIGCVRSLSKVISVIVPPAVFNTSPQNLCLIGNAPGTVTFNSLNSNASYTLNYGVDATSTLVTTSPVSNYAYSLPGVYTVSMTVKNGAGCTNSTSVLVTAVKTPTANFLFDSPGSTGGNSICSGKIVTFTNVSTPQTYTPKWNLGVGDIPNTNDIVTNFYTSQVTTSLVAISMTVSTGAPASCSASISKNFTIYAASADIAVSKTTVCLGETVQLNIVNPQGVSAWVWDFGDATPSGTVYTVNSPPSSTLHAYSNYNATSAGNASVSLIYWSMGEACKLATDPIAVKIIKIDADFDRNNEALLTDSIHCINIPDRFVNTTVSNSSALTYSWNFPGGLSSTSVSTDFLFTSPGVKQVTLNVRDPNNCKAQTIKNVTIQPLPEVSVMGGFNCPNVPFQLSANGSAGVVSGTWSPASGIVGSTDFTTTLSNFSVMATAAETSEFSVSVTDLNGCVSMPSFTTINIQQPPVSQNWDTTVVIGEPIPISGYVGDFYYTWNPVVSDLNCITCPNPVSSSTVNIVYSLIVEDTLGCSKVPSSFTIHILPKSSIDVPTAFTPNGDEVNDIIYADGWGIKKLNYFRVFNRYGQMIFESNDLTIGWNGTYKGVPQNMETYVYQVSAETYIDAEPITKSGTFKLLR